MIAELLVDAGNQAGDEGAGGTHYGRGRNAVENRHGRVDDIDAVAAPVLGKGQRVLFRGGRAIGEDHAAPTQRDPLQGRHHRVRTGSGALRGEARRDEDARRDAEHRLRLQEGMHAGQRIRIAHHIGQLRRFVRILFDTDDDRRHAHALGEDRRHGIGQRAVRAKRTERLGTPDMQHRRVERKVRSIGARRGADQADNGRADHLDRAGAGQHFQRFDPVQISHESPLQGV